MKTGATWTVAVLGGLAGLLATTGALARRPPASAGGFSLTLQEPNGGALPAFYYDAATYVLGRYGDRYAVRVTNHTGERIEAVVTVDGRDAVSGEVGDYVTQRGYIIPPYDSVVVEGFRRSLDTVATFRFTDPGNSYSGRRGTPQHVGVVGVAVFRERYPVPPPVVLRQYDERRRDDWYGLDDSADKSGLGTAGPPPAEAEAAAKRPSASAPDGDYALGGARGRSSAPAPRNNLGTQYGENRYSQAVETQFQRRRPRSPDQVLAIYYDDAQGLAARGINVYPYYSGGPSPFPNDQRFAAPPP